MTGMVFGRLTVVAFAGTTKGTPGGGNRHALWKCQCECGKEHIAQGKALRQGLTRSCGCLRKGLKKQHKQPDYIPSYYTTHARHSKVLGPAKDHPCATGCGSPAKHLSYKGGDPDEIIDNGLIYSTKPEYYEPLCQPCHYNRDRRQGAA